MKVLYIRFLVFCTFLALQNIEAQDVIPQSETSALSGSLQTNGNFYLRDSAIGAANIPQYDHQLVGADTWLTLNYNKGGYDIGVRFDIFNNSQLLNPRESYSASGIGRFYLKKRVNDLTIYGGHIYDQIGTGIIFRAYEDRPLGVDNALVGINLDYKLGEFGHVKAENLFQAGSFILFYLPNLNRITISTVFKIKRKKRKLNRN